MSDHPTTLTEAERQAVTDCDCGHDIGGYHNGNGCYHKDYPAPGQTVSCDCRETDARAPVNYAAAERIKADAYAAGLAARTPTATGDTEHVVTFTDSIRGLTWACTCGAIGGGATAPVKAAGLAHARSATGVTAGDDLRDRVTKAARAGRRAALDPGAFVKRGPDHDGEPYGERLDQWQERALLAAVDTVLAASPAPVVSRPEAEDEA